MLTDMVDRGLDFSASAFRDWQSKGLIADANHDGRWAEGQAGSVKGLWSDNQRKSLAALLGLRDRQRAAGPSIDVSGLGNVVVWLWLYWDGIVEVPQARKALRTWVWPQVGGPSGGARSEDRIRKASRATVRQLAAPGTRRSTRTAVSDHLADLYWTDDQDGFSRLLSDVRSLMDPEGKGRHVGSPLAPVAANDVAAGLSALTRAAHVVITDPGALCDADWAFARRFLKGSWSEYTDQWRLLVGSGDGAFSHERPDLGLQMRSASRSVLTVLGLRLADRV